MLLVSSNTLDCYSNEDFITNNNYVSSRSLVIMASDETSDGNPVIVKKMKDTNACMPNDMGSQSQNAVIQPLLTGMKNSHIFLKIFKKKHFPEIEKNENEFSCIPDLYQITMAYAYWKAGRIEDKAVFGKFFYLFID